MNNLINIQNLELETLKNLKNSKANNTLRAYQSDFRDFSKFCKQHGFKEMPTDPKTLSLYMTYLSSTLKFSTLRRRLASISILHKMRGHYIDIKHPIIIENLMGIKRRKGSKQIGKKPLLINDLKKIINVIDQINEKEKIRVRNKALLLIGFSGGFRRSELVNIEIEDLDFVDEGLKIIIKKSKTDQAGEGLTKGIPYFDNKNYCPVISLKNWINYVNINTGKIFNLSDKSVALIIKKYSNLAGLDSRKYAGHSLRSGFATSAAASGAEERNIMNMTGHKSVEMVRRYIKDADIFKNNALNKLKI